MATTKQILGKVVITNKGEYDSSAVYEILDVVSYQGSSYISKVYDNDSLPIDDTKWQLLAQKGDTYEVSESDIENIANKITENANSNFNRNVSEKTETFNSNAKTKTDEFNSNANNTISAYNVNAENKLKEYNENDTVKLKKYNDNATSSVDNYNSNAGTKLNEYNTNSVNKLKEYNDNATKAFNNYNSNATTKLDEYNANSDSKIKEYDEHSEELNTKINSTKNELERVKNNVLETGTGTGNFIHLEDSAMAELQELEIEGICEQKTTAGKNSLNVSKTIENSNGIKTTYNKDRSITIAGTTSVGWADLTERTNNKLSTGEYTFSTIEKKTYNIFIRIYYADNTTQDFTIVNNYLNTKFALTKETVEYRIYVNNLAIGKEYNDTLYLQLEKGNTQTNWEPYTGEQPSPSPDYPQEIKTITDSLSVTSCNKNIFDFEKLKKDNSLSEISGDSVDFTIKTKDVPCSLKFPILIDNLYINFKISSNKMNGSIKVIYEDDTLENVYEKYDNSIISDVNVSKLFNKNKKIKGIRILNFGKSTYFQIKEMLLAIDSKEELFVDHLVSMINATLPSNEFIGKLSDNDKDTLNVKYNEKDGQYHLFLNKKIKKLIMDGTINKFIHISSNIMTDTNNFFQFELPNKEFGKSGSIDYAKSNYLTYYDGNAATAIKSVCLWWENSEKYNYASLSYETLSEANSWLKQLNDAGRPLEIYYVEKNTYEIDLGVVDIPITYNEITNIFTDSDLLPQINVKYYRNFTKTIQNLQINNDTLKNELTSIEDRLTALENANITVESEVSE